MRRAIELWNLANHQDQKRTEEAQQQHLGLSERVVELEQALTELHRQQDEMEMTTIAAQREILRLQTELSAAKERSTTLQVESQIEIRRLQSELNSSTEEAMRLEAELRKNLDELHDAMRSCNARILELESEVGEGRTQVMRLKAEASQWAHALDSSQCIGMPEGMNKRFCCKEWLISRQILDTNPF